MRKIKKFAHWCWRLLKKGYWLLGLVPAVSGYLSTYFPANALPPLLSDILKAMANLQYTVIVVAACLLISAYLIHSETEAVLAAYQYQEPKYRLEIKNVTSEVTMFISSAILV